MENENNLPNDIESMTPEQAASEIDKTMSEAAKDPSHPYIDAHNPLEHRKSVERMQKLYEIKNQGIGEQDAFEQAAEKVMQEDAEKKEVIQRKIFEEGKAEFDKLIELGFDGELPETIEPYHVSGWKMQRLLIESNFKELAPMLEKGLSELKAPAENIEACRAFGQLQNINPEMRDKIYDIIVRDIFAANEEKANERKKLLEKISSQKRW